MDLLNKLAEKSKRLEICWIKAHVGHPGNERADEFARKAENQDIDLHITEAWSQYKNKVWKTIYQEWETRWTGENHYRMTKEFYPKPTSCKKSTQTKQKRHAAMDRNSNRTKQSQLYPEQNTQNFPTMQIL